MTSPWGLSLDYTLYIFLILGGFCFLSFSFPYGCPLQLQPVARIPFRSTDKLDNPCYRIVDAGLGAARPTFHNPIELGFGPTFLISSFSQPRHPPDR
jgi:hypothetical protein